MAKYPLKLNQAYAGSSIIMTTKHMKSIAVAPIFWDKLNASVLEHVVDTDMLGTFSGEIERTGSALECARRKCEWTLEQIGNNIEYALASEGSFGPHPFIPFLPCDQEILYFIDRKHGFHLHLSHLSENTNYQMQEINSFEELQKFAHSAQFPSHALILRPKNKKINMPIFKGIDSQESLDIAFQECLKHSVDGKLWVETDMRAQFNPLRMKVIGELATKFADRLLASCPECNTPGWGKVSTEKGLNCRWCGSETGLVKSEILGCVKCDYKEFIGREDGLTSAEPVNCGSCNP